MKKRLHRCRTGHYPGDCIGSCLRSEQRRDEVGNRIQPWVLLKCIVLLVQSMAGSQRADANEGVAGRLASTQYPNHMDAIGYEINHQCAPLMNQPPKCVVRLSSSSV
jgi:hypothetical protein